MYFPMDYYSWQALQGIKLVMFSTRNQLDSVPLNHSLSQHTSFALWCLVQDMKVATVLPSWYLFLWISRMRSQTDTWEFSTHQQLYLPLLTFLLLSLTLSGTRSSVTSITITWGLMWTVLYLSEQLQHLTIQTWKAKRQHKPLEWKAYTSVGGLWRHYAQCLDDSTWSQEAKSASFVTTHQSYRSFSK